MKVAIAVALVPDNSTVKKEFITSWTDNGNVITCAITGHIVDANTAQRIIDKVLEGYQGEAEVEVQGEVENG